MHLPPLAFAPVEFSLVQNSTHGLRIKKKSFLEKALGILVS